jgi:hypothetical protein
VLIEQGIGRVTCDRDIDKLRYSGERHVATVAPRLLGGIQRSSVRCKIKGEIWSVSLRSRESMKGRRFKDIDMTEIETATWT